MKIGFLSSSWSKESGLTYYIDDLAHYISSFNYKTAYLKSVSKKSGIDLVHFHHKFGFNDLQLLKRIRECQSRHIPIVTTFHSIKKIHTPQEKEFIKQIIKASSRITVHNHYLKKILEENINSRLNVKVVEQGIREVKLIDNAKVKLHLDGKKVILLCGFFRPAKGFHRVIQVFPEVSKRGKNTVLLIAGKFRKGEYAIHCRDFYADIRNSPKAGKIILKKGLFSARMFDIIMSSADVVVLPYEAGSHDDIIARAFAFRKPVVVSDLPGFILRIKESRGGLIVRNDRELTNSIVKLLQDLRLAGKMQKNIINYISKRGSWKKSAFKYHKLYKEVIYG